MGFALSPGEMVNRSRLIAVSLEERVSRSGVVISRGATGEGSVLYT
jgi:hypothetical protein